MPTILPAGIQPYALIEQQIINLGALFEFLFTELLFHEDLYLDDNDETLTLGQKVDRYFDDCSDVFGSLSKESVLSAILTRNRLVHPREKVILVRNNKEKALFYFRTAIQKILDSDCLSNQLSANVLQSWPENFELPVQGELQKAFNRNEILSEDWREWESYCSELEIGLRIEQEKCQSWMLHAQSLEQKLQSLQDANTTNQSQALVSEDQSKTVQILEAKLQMQQQFINQLLQTQLRPVMVFEVGSEQLKPSDQLGIHLKRSRGKEHEV